MSAIGMAIGSAANNMGLLRLELPIGLGCGAFINRKMDQKATKEKRQLSISLL
jgi:hypothetical protein